MAAAQKSVYRFIIIIVGSFCFVSIAIYIDTSSRQLYIYCSCLVYTFVKLSAWGYSNITIFYYRCKFGHYGADCSRYQVLSRRSVADFSDAEWTDYNRIIKLTRTYDSGYVAVLEETYPGNTSLRTAPLTLYGMFIWLHHYAAKDSQVLGEDCMYI